MAGGQGPGSGDVSVALSALRSDATVWNSASQSISTQAVPAVQGLTLTAAQFSYWADQQGVTQSYTATQNKIADLLAGVASNVGAAQNFQKISTTLLGVADAYAKTEGDNVNRFKAIHNK